jgi:hypothetical protein
MYDFEAEPTKRDQLVRGLQSAAAFLHYAVDLPLNVGRFDITYCVINDDQGAARAEFEDLTAMLRAEVEGDATAWFVETDDVEHEGTVQHSTRLVFRGTPVAYQVLWIEKTGDTEDED